MKKILLISFFLFNIISNGQSSEKNYISDFETYNGDNSVNVVVEIAAGSSKKKKFQQMDLALFKNINQVQREL